MDNQIDDEGLRRAALEARAHLLRAVEFLAAEGRDSLMDPVHTGPGTYGRRAGVGGVDPGAAAGGGRVAG